MKKVSELISWLNTPDHIKCVLAEITDVGNAPVLFTNTAAGSVYLSSTAYYSNNIDYLPIIDGGLRFNETLNIEGSISSSFGSLELTNIAGIHDSYLQYVWKRRPIKIYLGDPSWPRADFVMIFDGLVEDLVTTNESILSLSVFDKLQRLNDNITEKTLSDTAYSQKPLSTILPVLFGECFNITPLMVDNGITENTGQVYMVHDGAINGLIEVRDNGVPINVDINTTKGTFALLTQPNSTITCSVQGYATGGYAPTVPGIINTIVKNYGSQTNRFTDSEISFSDFTNTSKVGIYCKDRANILEVCAEIARSVGSGLICTSITVVDDSVEASKLRLVELKNPVGTPKFYLNDAAMVEGTLSVSQTFPVKPSIKLAYCKNYTVQESPAKGLHPSSNFADAYLYADATSTSQQTLYRDSGITTEEITLLLAADEAQAEADKRLALWSTQRVLITATYVPEYLFVQLGDIVSVQSNRFNLTNGKLGIVYSIDRDWISGNVQIGVLV